MDKCPTSHNLVTDTLKATHLEEKHEEDQENRENGMVGEKAKETEKELIREEKHDLWNVAGHSQPAICNGTGDIGGSKGIELMYL